MYGQKRERWGDGDATRHPGGPIVAHGPDRVNSRGCSASEWTAEGVKPSAVHFCYEISGSAGDRRVAERQVDYLRYLASSGAVSLAEVWAVLRVTWLAKPSTSIALYDTVAVGCLHVLVERSARQDVLE